MFHRFAFGRAMPPVPPACEWTTVRAAPGAPRIAEGVESVDPVPCVDGRGGTAVPATAPRTSRAARAWARPV